MNLTNNETKTKTTKQEVANLLKYADSRVAKMLVANTLRFMGNDFPKVRDEMINAVNHDRPIDAEKYFTFIGTLRYTAELMEQAAEVWS